MRSWIVILLVIICCLIVPVVEGSTFHLDEQRTGNFSDEGPKLPGILWKANLTALVGSSPVYHDGVVYATNWYGGGSWEPGLYAINASDGKIIWRNKNITGVSTVSVSGDQLFVGNLEGELCCINLTNGEEIWSKKLEKNPAWHGISSSPLICNDTIYVTTFSDGTLRALNSTGNELWNFTTGGKISYYTSPSAHDGRVFFAGNGSEPALYCLNESGDEIWNYTVESAVTNTPAVTDEKVFFATKDRFYTVSSDGNELWNTTFNGSMSTAALAHGNAYVGSKEGVLYCMNQSTGKFVWNFTANGKISSSPAVTDEVVYFGTNTPNGTVYALNVSNGNLLWEYSLDPPQGEYYNIMSSPHVVDHKLFIGADDGNVYCVGNELQESADLSPGNFSIEAESGKKYRINNLTALGALNTAVEDSYTVKDDWFDEYETLLVDSIYGIRNNNSSGWSYWVNYPNESMPPTGANAYEVGDGDTVQWYYSTGMNDTPSNSPYVIEIEVDTQGILINSFNVTNASRGGDATAWVNVTAYADGWYVIVVSGSNTNSGESVAGASTVKLDSGQTLKIPLIVSIPQQVPAGDYELYAGIYKLNDYPNNLLDWYGHRTCEVK
ncbi:MAG: PQQ-binding-like beta-propeller repeat protein [Archaeoglobaceae archaeon]